MSDGPGRIIVSCSSWYRSRSILVRRLEYFCAAFTVVFYPYNHYDIFYSPQYMSIVTLKDI